MESLSSSKIGRWKREADAMVNALSDAENKATSLEQEINHAIDNNTNPALQTKHASLAAAWVKKFQTKKAFIVRTKTLASNAREEALNKEGNKFEESLKTSKDLIAEWESDGNMGLLLKLLNF